MQQVLNTMADTGKELNDALSSLIHSLSALPREFEEWRPSEMFTVADTLARAGSVGGLVDTLTTMPQDRFALVPANRLVTLSNAFVSLVRAIERGRDQFGQLEAWGGLNRFDPTSGQVVAQNGNSINAKNILDEIGTQIDTVLDAHIPIVATTQPRSVGTFVAAARELRRQASEAARLVAELSKQQAQLASKIEKTAAHEDDANTSATEASRLLTEIEQARKTADENAAKVAALLASVETVSSDAADLSAQVNAFEMSFQGFQAALDAREEALAEGDHHLSQLIDDLKKNQSEIAAQNAQAAQMLGGATVAGLSSTYKTQGDSVAVQLCWARCAFYAAVSLMVVSVAFSLNVFGEFMPAIVPEQTEEAGALAVRVFAAIGSRALVLLPSILLVAFAARRHAALFQLREEYSHKYNIAASVNGFKQQAPNYEQQIAAAVFLELLENPTSGLRKGDQRRSNDIVSSDLLPTVVDAIKQLKEGKGSG